MAVYLSRLLNLFITFYGVEKPSNDKRNVSYPVCVGWNCVIQFDAIIKLPATLVNESIKECHGLVPFDRGDGFHKDIEYFTSNGDKAAVVGKSVVVVHRLK